MTLSIISWLDRVNPVVSEGLHWKSHQRRLDLTCGERDNGDRGGCVEPVVLDDHDWPMFAAVGTSGRGSVEVARRTLGVVFPVGGRRIDEGLIISILIARAGEGRLVVCLADEFGGVHVGNQI